MGRDKAMLLNNGVSLLKLSYDKARAALKDFNSTKVFVSGDYPEFNGVKDILPQRGPIEGLWSCSRYLGYETNVLVFPVDMPLLSQAHFKILFESLVESEFVQFEDYEMPFVFKFNSRTEKVLKAVRCSDSSSSRSIKNFKSLLQGKIVTLQEGPFFKNVNTPQDWNEVVNETAFKSQ